MSRTILACCLIGLAGFFFAPWYAIEDGLFSTEWLPYYPGDPELAPAFLQALWFDRSWLLPIVLFVALPLTVIRRPKSDRHAANLLIACGALGLMYGLAQGYAIGPLGWSFATLESAFGPIAARQYGMGWGALLVHAALLFLLTEGLARRGAVRGDSFVSGALGLSVASVALFVFLPIALILLRAIETEEGTFSAAVLSRNLFAPQVWSLPPFSEGLGTAWKSLILALISGTGCTILGLAFALIVTRTKFPLKRPLRALTVLPIITPPFVVGLSLILLFGRSGAITVIVAEALGIEPSRWVFGLPGIVLAQLLSLTPISFLVLIGVVEGIGPSMEEAAQTLRADRWRTFRTVTLPLMRPGIANAFLLAFIESLADFGNPLVLGGSWDVLSTEIYFAVAGATNDVPRASALAIVLLAFTLAAFWAQQRWVGRGTYTTVTGKGDSGIPPPLPNFARYLAYAIALPWAAFTAGVYAIVVFGGFVRVFGHDHTLTLAHYREMFAISGMRFTGGAWSSLFTTVEVALISAPLTAALGLLVAWLLARQRFKGDRTFELGTMLSFAIPGTVVGVSYVLAFNAPPLEMTGTAVLLVICFIFRNMPVGTRAGMATLSQIDKSLDEASLTLGASSAHTIRRIVLPLLKPALIAALVYGFVRAMTAVSAVIFLVSADHDLATTYILGRVENGAYGPAIAYSSVLIVLMTAAIGSIQFLVGRREIGRRELLP
jgi:iron(III) transport system permease protein